MLKFNDWRKKPNEIQVHQLISENDKESIGKLFTRSDEITNILKRQLEDYHFHFGYFNIQSNSFVNKLSKDNIEISRAILTCGNIQAQMEFRQFIFKNVMEDFLITQESNEFINRHQNSPEFFIELLIPECHNIFRSYEGKATGGQIGNVLAKSGVKMVFIFMQRLWRVGNELDVENCVEVIKSAVEEMQEIPVASFFNLTDECRPLPFWIGVTEQTYQFLKSTVLSIETNDTIAPKQVRNAALVLLLEMGLIYGSLSMQLKHVIMLIELSAGRKNYPNLSICSQNEVPRPMISGRILSVLARLAKFVKSVSHENTNAFERSLQMVSNPCLRLLNWMHLDNMKEDESTDVDICFLNAAVYIMSCLDSLTVESQLSYASWYKSHLMNSNDSNPSISTYPDNFFSFSSIDKSNHKLFFIRLKTCQSLLKNENGDSILEVIEMNPEKLPKEKSEIFRMKKIVYSGVNTYILTESGWLYEINSTSDEMIETFTFKHNAINYHFDCSKNECSSTLDVTNKIIDVDANVYSSHVLAVTETGLVYSWGTNTSGKLGHGDVKDRRHPTIIETLNRSHILVKQVACGEEHSLILTQSGEIYGCGRNHMGQLGLGDVKDRHLPTRLGNTDLYGVIVRQIAADCHQSMCLSNDGLIFTWGNTRDNCRRHSSNWVPKVDTCVHEYRNEIERIQVHDSTYTILLKSGSVYTWLKYCVECNKSDGLPTDMDTVLKHQVDNISMISKSDGEFYFLDRSGIIRTKKMIKISDHKFSGFGFVKRNYILAWSLVKEKPKLILPFKLEVSIENLKLLSSLIQSVIINFGNATDGENLEAEKLDSSTWFQYILRANPHNKFELTEDRLCVLVSSLHILSVQLQKIVEERLTIPAPLLIQLKRNIINCCCGSVSQLHVGIKHAAHMCLISGWQLLFSSQMEKLLGIYYTLQIAEPCMSRYNLIVAMCLDTINLKQFIDTLIELSSNSSAIGSDLPTIEDVIETILKYTFTHIRSQLKLPSISIFKTQDNGIPGKSKIISDHDLLMNNNATDTGDYSIINKLLNFLRDLIKQMIILFKNSKATSDHMQLTLKSIFTIYGKYLAQQATETIDHCWSLVNKSSMTPKLFIQTLHKSGFGLLLMNFIESMRWLLKNYLQSKSIGRSDYKSLKNNPKLFGVNPMYHYDLLFKFSINMREIVFAFRPLISALDKINRLNESILVIDSEDVSLPGWLYNPHTQFQQSKKVVFRMNELMKSDGQLIVIENRVYDLDKLSVDSTNLLKELLPNRNSIIITDNVCKSLYRKEILDLLMDCYCGEYVDDDGQPISYFDNDSDDSSQLYFIERMLLMLISDVLLFHQSCCSLMKRSICFKQLQELSLDKFPPVLRQIVLKKKSDQLLTNTDISNATILSFGHWEEKERDEVEETNDVGNSFIVDSNDDINRKMINTCVNLLMYGSSSSLVDKGTSIIANVLQWLRSDLYKNKNLSKANVLCLLDNIQDSNLDTLFVLILIALARHVNICEELANHIMRRNFEQPMSNELKIIIQQSISIRKDIIKRHQQSSTVYKELCSNIVVRCRFLIDEIELLTTNNNFTNRKKSINLTDFTSEMSVSNRWKCAALKAVAFSKKPKTTTDYWQIVYNFVSKKFSNSKSKPINKTNCKFEDCETIKEFCGQISHFLLNKENIDLQKLRTLVLAKKIQYKCIINILREFKSLLQFCNGLLPGAQMSLLQFFYQKVPLNEHTEDDSNDDEYIYDILQSVNSVSTSNFVSSHTKQSLLQTEYSLIQLCLQLLRDNLMLNDQKTESLKCYKFLNNQSPVIGVGYWPNAKLSLIACNLLLQSISWSNDIFHMIVSSGLFGLIQTLFRQYYETEPGLVSIWCQQASNYQLLPSDNRNGFSQKNKCESFDDISNSDIATPSQLKKGTLVLRGRDWKYGDQDGPNSVGIVKREIVNGMVRVIWLNNNKSGSYRAGKNNCYDLRLKKNIEDIDNENTGEVGMRSLMKDISMLQEKFRANRLSHKNLDFEKSTKVKLDDKTLSKFACPSNWTQPSMLLLHCAGQLMQAIVIQQFSIIGTSKSTTPCQTTFKKIYQLLWLIYKNGMLTSIHRNDSVKNMFQEQIKLWGNERLLLALLNQQNSNWLDCDRWLDLFLTKAKIQIKLSSNENVANQILTLKIIERLIDRISVSNDVMDRLWNCLQQAILAHCSQYNTLVFNVHSVNASPSKIRIMELAIIFRNMLRNSSANYLPARQFIFEKIASSLEKPNDYIQILGLFCLFSDIENRIYPGIPCCSTNENSDQKEQTVYGIVKDICVIDNKRYVITIDSAKASKSQSTPNNLDKELDVHTFTSDIKIDTVKVQFPFEIFNSMTETESGILSEFLLKLLANFTSSNAVLSKTSTLKNLFDLMQLTTVLQFCEHNFAGLRNALSQSTDEIFGSVLNSATRCCSIKPTVSINELGRALSQLSMNLFCSPLPETISSPDNENYSDAETENLSVSQAKIDRQWNPSSNTLKTAIKHPESKCKTNSLNISLDLQYRIMEMGFSKRQIQLAVKKLSKNGDLCLMSNPELIVTTILSLEYDDEYSLSPGDNVDDDDDDDEGDESHSISSIDTASSYSGLSETCLMPTTKLRHVNKLSDHSVNSSDNDENEDDDQMENEYFYSNQEDEDNRSSSLENASDYGMNPSAPDLNQDLNDSENVICVKPIDPISIGDKGIFKLPIDEELTHLNIFWTRINQFIETDKVNVHLFTSLFSSIIIGDEVKFSDFGIQYHSVSSMSALRTGIVRQIIGNQLSLQFVVDFPDNLGKICDVSHLNLVSKDNHNCQCQSCLKSPLCLPLYKCKICKNLYMCSDCYSKFQKFHHHKFATIDTVNDSVLIANSVSESTIFNSRKIQFPTVTSSVTKSEFKQCLSFTNWPLNRQTTTKIMEVNCSSNNCLVKIPDHYRVTRIFMLISLSEFLTLPSHVIVQSGVKSKKLITINRIHVQSSKDDEILRNSPKYYNPESKLIWLKIYQKKSNSLQANNHVFSLDLLDESSSIKTVFNAVKSLHFQLSKRSDEGSQHNIKNHNFSDISNSIGNENMLRTIFSISDKNWSFRDIDNILNNTTVSWRQARFNKLLFQVKIATKGVLSNDHSHMVPSINDGNIDCYVESNSQGDSKFKNKFKSKVYVWGLNDKDQLGCEAASKVKLPILNEALSELDCVSISGGSKSLFCVTRTGKVYVAGDPSNGRLGISSDSDIVIGPKKLEGLDKYFIVKVAVHSGGRHSMALTKNGEIFSWGEGEDGKLGHNSRLKVDYPRKIKFFKGKRVVDIACGSNHSAAIVFGGHLYTWGLGDYGRLGHGDTTTALLPKMVKNLRDYKVVQVACGSRDAQTLALTSDFKVWSWGDGDFGKLGRGGSSGCLTPQKIDCLSFKNVIQIECGAQSSFALTETGQVWTWGKGDYYRLGHGQDKHVREPMQVEDLKGVKIVHLAVGALHCLAVTDQGHVYSWGDNDHGQQGNGTVSYNTRPTLVTALADIKISHVACGSSHSVAWTASDLDTFMPSQSLNRWPYIKELSYSLAVIDFSPLPFQFSPDPLGASDLLDIDQNIFQKMGKSIEAVHLSEIENNQTESCNNLAIMVSQLHNHNTQASVIQSLFVNLQVLIARKLVFQLMTQKGNPLPIMTNEADNVIPSNLNHQISTVDTFLLAFDFLKLHNATSLNADSYFKDILKSIDFNAANDLKQAAILLLIDEIEKFSDNDSSKDNSIHQYCDNKDFVNIIKKTRFTFVRESPHPYHENSKLSGKIIIPDAPNLIVEFDKQCSTERNRDILVLMDHKMSIIAERSGQREDDWGSKVVINGNELHWSFKSDGSVTSWGWRFEVKPLWKSYRDHKHMDNANDGMEHNELFILFSPNLHLIKGLFATIDLKSDDTSLALQMIKSLSQMAFTRGHLDCESRIWAVRQITTIIRNLNLGVYGQITKAVESFSMMCPRFDSRNVTTEEETLEEPTNFDMEDDEMSSDDDQPERSTQLITNMDTICSFLLCLQKVVLKQFKYEEPEVKSSKQLFYSRFLKSLLELSCYIKLDSLAPVSTGDEWTWFRNYCLTSRTTDSLLTNASLPYRFINEFKSRFLTEPTVKDPLTREINALTAVSEYADPREFSFQHDLQLVSWLKIRPDAWKRCWPTDSASGLEVWSWGHNHRGQLGGVEGSKIKVPVLCEHLSALRPKQIIGGEQSLFIVSIDGRVYATGFGNNGRLGIGSTESVQTPILVSGLEEKIVIKVAVNSGGKHCLALCNNGLVYAWGDGEDHKLGLDNRLQSGEDVLVPVLIKSLVKAEIVDIAAGGSHSAAISRSGELYTWGKGRYGRLGHGNGDDQPFPKIVEALRGYHVIGVACGSGDAQTLCITKATDDTREGLIPNTSVWSWGDGDYGKLGRGGFDICKLPMKIETLEGAGVIKVDCGSQFSLALTASGDVYTWGKGDYFRLGHGSDTHVRKPEKIAQLNRKKIIDVACGSLHCICCTEEGEVYSWGDNDEGQLGDGTTTTNSRPRIIETLTGKGINRVSCGSAHTLSWTTVSANKSHETESPEQRLVLSTRPPNFTLLENKSAQSLINRFLLLHHWTELFCTNLHFFDLNRQSTMDTARQILLPSSKESLFRLMIQTTMYGSKKHGPEIKVNRLHASAGTPAGVSILYRSGWMELDNQAEEATKLGTNDTVVGRSKIQLEKTVFGQLGSKLIEEADCISKNGSVYIPPPDFFLLPNRVWKVKLIGESVDDCGGGYSESITEICDELQNGHLPFLISSTDKDCFVLSPNMDKADIKWFIFLGCLLGIAIRTNQPLSLTISDLIWKILSGQSLNRNDLQLLDKDLLNSLLSLNNMDDNELENLQIPFSVNTIDGREVSLLHSDDESNKIVTATNRAEYIESIIYYKIHEFDQMCSLIRRGMSLVIPLPLLNLFSSRELESLVCGNDSIPISFLKSITLYRGVKSDDPIILWFWEIMEEMTNEVRSLFLRFVWGRTRLPRYVSDLRGKEFVIQVLSKYSPADDYLPEAYTCFFLLKLPNYSGKAILQEKLLYAIHFCKSIDIDDYARIALNPDSLPCQEIVPTFSRRERERSQTSSSGSNSSHIYLSHSLSQSCTSQDDDDASTTRAPPNALFDSSPSLSDRYSVQRNNQYLVSDYMELFSGVFDQPRFIDMSLDTEDNGRFSSDDEFFMRNYGFPREE